MQVDLQDKVFEGERNVLNAKIESLEKSSADQSEQIIRLSRHLDEAYQKIQNIAIKSVGGDSDIKPSQQLVEQAK